MTLHTQLVRAAFLAAALIITFPIIMAPAQAQSGWDEDQRGRWVPPEDRRRNDDDRYYDRRYDWHSDRDRRYDDDDRDRYSRRDRDRDRDRNDPADILQQLLR